MQLCSLEERMETSKLLHIRVCATLLTRLQHCEICSPLEQQRWSDGILHTQVACFQAERALVMPRHGQNSLLAGVARLE